MAGWGSELRQVSEKTSLEGPAIEARKLKEGAPFLAKANICDSSRGSELALSSNKHQARKDLLEV